MGTMRAILAILLLCTAISCGRPTGAAAQELPSSETIAHGRALAAAGDCAGCHTADPAKPFAGGKRIDTPFGAVYSANLTPDADNGAMRISGGRSATASRRPDRTIIRPSPILTSPD
jgi:predicted CxxxxCH...CXXCH cytochrome family protein